MVAKLLKPQLGGLAFCIAHIFQLTKMHFFQMYMEQTFLALLKGPYYADHILIPQGSTGSSIFFLISNESPYFSDCKSKISASNTL